MTASRSLLLRAVLARSSSRPTLLSCSLVLVLAAPSVFADVPGRVGRIAFLQGDVQAYSETDPEWKAAYVNQPVTSRNSVFVGDAGRAEISVGSTTLAMDAGSQVDIQQLDDNTFDANVVRGRVSMRIRRFDPSDVYDVAVRGATFSLLRPGRYRIDSLESTSGITVFEGQANVESDRPPVLVQAGNAMRVAVDARDPNAPPQLLSAAPVSVPLDDWVVARENRFRNSQTERYVSSNMTGYEDLDANGRWATEQDVGPIWYPTTYVQTDWAPYRYGRWAYVAPWGYTWIDDAPWGFAPFHYGRWIQVGGRWGWTPGAYVSRPAYAPALVGFYGGSGFSASFAVGSGPAVGWYPLAPWQRYSPHYTRNTTYVNQVNNITIVNPPPRFARGGGGHEWNREHGGTLAPQEAFASQRSISRVAIAAPPNLAERASTVSAVDLPRPSAIPGAIRRGPESGGGRPDFRPAREFATRPFDGGPRGQEQGVRAGPAAVNEAPRPGFDRERERNGLPSTYRRLEERRPEVVAPTAERPQQVPGVPPVVPSSQQSQPPQRGPDGPRFNREPRPETQPAPIAPAAPVAPLAPAPAVQPRGDYRPNAESPRFGPRVQPGAAPDGGNRPDDGRPQPQERGFERPNREFRNMQPPPVQPSPVQPQIVPQAQPQPVERPRFERPQPVPQAPQAPAMERPQRVERPAAPAPMPVPAAPPPAPVAQPRPQAPAPRPENPAAAGEVGRPGIRER